LALQICDQQGFVKLEQSDLVPDIWRSPELYRIGFKMPNGSINFDVNPVANLRVLDAGESCFLNEFKVF
jgi:hypothetical protein